MGAENEADEVRAVPCSRGRNYERLPAPPDFAGWALVVRGSGLMVCRGFERESFYETGARSLSPAQGLTELVMTQVRVNCRGDAQLCELQGRSGTGESLFRLPGGWIETQPLRRRGSAGPVPPGSENFQRLEPRWSRSDLEAVAKSLHIGLRDEPSVGPRRQVLFLGPPSRTWTIKIPRWSVWMVLLVPLVLAASTLRR